LVVDNLAPYSFTDTSVAIGSYTYYAVALDDGGFRSTNTVSVNVAGVQQPIVNAGPDQTIILPLGANLAGYSLNCVSNLWTKVSGSGTATFTDATVTNTTAAFSAAGTYGLRLTGYGSATNSASDDMVLTVMSNTPSGTVSIPIYLDGIGQPSQSRSVTLSGVGAGDTYLQLLLHHASIYPCTAPKMTVSVNGQAAVGIMNNTVTVLPLLGRPDLMHGLGGSYEAMWVELRVPAGVAANGQNTLNFQHTFPAGTTTARTLIAIPALNWRNSGGSFLMVTNGVLVEQDVLTGPDYAPSAYNDTSVVNGQNYYENTITTYPGTAGSTTQPCAGCHTKTAWDMAYFSFPRVAVIGAARRFGAGEIDANNIYNYIWRRRATDTNAFGFGRVWNPPYQPGPGMDSKPIREWAAGAGINAVVQTDFDVFKDVFGGPTVQYSVITNAWTKTGPGIGMNIREQRINIQLPSIYHWYPKFHPLRQFSSFANSDVWKMYTGAIPCMGTAGGVRGAAAAYASSPVPTITYAFNDYWHADWTRFLLTIQGSAVDNTTGRYVTDYGNWRNIKMLEMMQEFNLERSPLPSSARERMNWYDWGLFDLAPNILKTPYGADGLQDGTTLQKRYFTVAWYAVQIALNAGNYSNGIMKNDIRPMDWPYSYGFFIEMTLVENGAPSAGMLLQNQVKAYQCQDFNTGVLAQDRGWSPNRNSPLTWLHNPTLDGLWSSSKCNIPAAQRTAYYDAMTKYWVMKSRQFTPAQYYAFQNGGVNVGGSPSWSGPNPAATKYFGELNGQFLLPEQLWECIGAARNHGVSAAVINDLKAFCVERWPAAAWAGR
jgi:hypothetical protein